MPSWRRWRSTTSPMTSSREIERAFHEHAVLVFPGQHLDAGRAGRVRPALRTDRGAVPGVRRGADHDGRARRLGDGPRQPGDAGVRGNQGWHTDSSYMPVSAKASMLSAQVVPTEGGETEWADMRAAYDALDEATRERVAALCAHHSIAYSQANAGFDATFGYGMDRARPAAPAREGAPRDGASGAVHRPSRPRHPRPRRRTQSDALLDELLRPPASRRACTATGGSPATSRSGTTAACCTAPASGTSPSRG